jgi:very-short-patch-repair endonuclease
VQKCTATAQFQRSWCDPQQLWPTPPAVPGPNPRGQSVITGNVVTVTQNHDLDRLLRRQHGAVSRAQLRERGVNANTIDTWVRRGRLRRILPAVYSTGPPSLATRAHAAHLWQPNSVVSHLAAAHLWKMAVDEPVVVHLTLPLGLVRTSPVPWLRLFRRDTPRTRCSTVGGLPVTDVPRTVFDCLALLEDAACAALLDHATATLTSDRALRMRYSEDLGMYGSPRIARQLASLVPGAASAPERQLAHGLKSSGLTHFLINEPVCGYIADFLDPARRLILEVDGYCTHGTWLAFQDDRARQNVLVAHGYTVLRYTAHDVQTRLGSILDEVTDIVARSSQQTSRSSKLNGDCAKLNGEISVSAIMDGVATRPLHPQAAAPHAARSAQPAGGLHCPIGQHQISTGPADGGQRFHHGAPPVQPAARHRRLDHRVLTRDLISGDGDVGDLSD